MESFEFAGWKFPRKIPRLVPTAGASSLPAPVARQREKYREWRRESYGPEESAPKVHRFTVDASYLTAPKTERPRQTAFFETLESGGFRFIYYADKILDHLDHTGWFTHPDLDETFRGCVLQLPGRGGKARFVAAYEESVSGGYVVDLTHVFEEDSNGEGYTLNPKDHFGGVRDAAFVAESMAEHAAEKERDYQTAWAAGSYWAQLGEEITADRRQLLEILAERRKVSNVEAPALCQVIRGEVESLLESIRQARAKRERLKGGDYEHFGWFGSELEDAFNEGAGEDVFKHA